MRIFLYGTLLDDVLRTRLIGRAVDGVAATLQGYSVVSQADAPIPALVPRKGGVASGILLELLTPDEVQRLDSYEYAFGYTTSLVTVQANGVDEAAIVYLADPSCPLSETHWSMDRWQAEMGDLSRERAVEIGRADPPLDSAALRQQWKMIGSRAASRLRAAQEEPPSTLRYAARPQDVSVTDRAPLVGDFFKFSQFNMVHHTFKGTTTPVLPREAIIGVDAAIILPYDPASDCVLLVEQIRTGPLMRGAPNPWVLEPVAGMIDPGETPEQAALRETEEEAGLTDITLQKMFQCYASPGGSTDHFYCYLALARLPEPTSYTGGMVDENEDLRIHVVPFADAINLITTGEANIGPLIAMLLWLERERTGLRPSA